MRVLVKYKVAIAALVVIALLAVIAVLVKLRAKPAAVSQVASEEKVLLPNGQPLSVFQIPKPEKGLLIFITNNAQHKIEYARQFAQLSYTVAALDSGALLSHARGTEPCINLAKYLDDLRQQLQTKYDLDQDNLPILVGADEGAALVYTALAQTEANNVHAGISINFKAEMPNTGTPFCTLNNFSLAGATPAPAKRLLSSWYIFQDKSLAEANHTSQFTNQVSNARLTIADDPSLPPLVEAVQVLQWLDPRLTDQISSDLSDSDLPLIEVTRDKPDADAEPSETQDTQAATTVAATAAAPVADALPDTMAILLTGDGGWAEIDKHIARLLADKGIPTVALDSLSYFWKTRTPVDTAQDIEGVITEYREKWQKQRVILIGYSFGADVLPFIANKLTDETQKHVALVALLGMGKTAAFEFRLSSWMNADKSANRLPLPPEVKAMSWAKSVCIYGLEDPDTQCASTGELGVKPISMAGDHHFDEKYDELVQHIIDNAKP